MALALCSFEEIMPIRFRCAYCNQLMGIATRKAGTVIRCPKCAGEIIVPTPDDVGVPEKIVNPLNATFEDKALDRLLEPSATQPAREAPSDSPDSAFLLGPER